MAAGSTRKWELEMRAIGLAAAALVLFFATGACAAILVDGSTQDGSSNQTEEVRDETLTFGTVLNTTPNISIDQIQFSLHPKGGMDVTFYILETDLGGAAGSVTWLPDGDGTVLIRQSKKTSAKTSPTDYFLVADPLTSAGSPSSSRNSMSATGSINTTQGGLGSTNTPTNSLGPSGDGNVAFVPQAPLSTPTGGPLLPEHWLPVVDESGDFSEGEIGHTTLLTILDSDTSPDPYAPGGQDESSFNPSIPQAALETEHMPEPSTLTIFGLGSLALAYRALRRAFSQAGLTRPAI